MQLNTVDLDYLDEKIRENTGYIAENEMNDIPYEKSSNYFYTPKPTFLTKFPT